MKLPQSKLPIPPGMSGGPGISAIPAPSNPVMINPLTEQPTVAIVSTGQPRPFHLRPRGGGASRSWQLGHGDLFVMGGSCQHDWEHCVPKIAAAGPRLSIMFRHNLADLG